MKVKHLAFAVAVALGASNMAIAQETTSSIRGNLTSTSGQVVANAKVEVLHVPTGTRSLATTNESGVFSSTGLRVGGPYTITITSEQGTKVYQNVFLNLGEPLRLNAQLESNVERIAVTGSAVVYANNTGSSSFFGSDQIENAPSFNRDIKDIIRNNPLVNISGADGTISVAGTNPRFNSIAIDGIGLNDDFGLNATGYPTTRSPISLDSIEQLIVDTSPFNAKDSGFQGAKINAVTKSGSNTTSGSFFFEKQNDSMAGKYKAPGSTKKTSLDFDEETWGGTLGGAVVQDKLFFFASYENYSSPKASGWGPAGAAGVANPTNATLEDLAQITEIAKRVYGVEVGGWDVNPETKEEKILLKLDWNINDSQRAALTYQRSEGNQINNFTDSSSSLKLSSQWYSKTEEMDSYAFKLFSDWTPDFSTEFYLTYQDRSTAQESLSELPQVFINVGGDSNRRVAFGSDHSRHANELANETFIIGMDGTYLLDDHKLTFGYQYKKIDANNLFVQYARGSYTFNSIEDFENRSALDLRYANSPSLDPNDAAVAFTRGEHAIYVQDEFELTSDLLISLGLRYERMATDDVPVFNEGFFNSTGYRNTENLDGLDIFLPRFSFRWDAADELVIRGGIGRFSGGQPTVWAGNAYGKNGLSIVDTGAITQTRGGTAEMRDDLQNVDITSVPESFLNYIRNGAQSEINFNDPNFEIPSDWRFQLAADYQFNIGDFVEDVLWTTEYTYVKPENSAYWKNVNAGDVFYTTTDGRKLYKNSTKEAIVLTNADEEGRSHLITTLLAKKWQSGVSLNASYTYQDITNATVGSASTANGNFGNNIAINRNETLVGTSPYETKHRFVVNLSYRTEFFDGYTTSFDTFFERKSGKALSYLANVSGTATRNALGYDYGGGMLAYIPEMDDTQYKFASEAKKTEFYNTVAAMGLSDYIGSYLPKSGFNSPWVTTWDISIRQQIPGFVASHKGELYFTIDNFLNFIDHSKGIVRDTQYGSINLYAFNAVDQNTGQLTINPFTPRGGSNWERFNQDESTWRLKVGVKYRF
ncbi:TonB-dependent receptor [Rheinheimera metallidurans]|uniref:TonB-dependent receptor n=1 Tax=Rheinheimera metallidurans TaxID=2925781 RepID=UPI0030027463